MHRLQVAVIPLRRTSRGVQVCLIRRKDSPRWGIPKGFIDQGDTKKGAALNEAYEEAGLSGDIVGKSIGTYDYTKGGLTRTVTVFLMDVQETHKTWDEMEFRERRWCSLDEACSLLEEHGVCALLDRVRAELPAIE